MGDGPPSSVRIADPRGEGKRKRRPHARCQPLARRQMNPSRVSTRGHAGTHPRSGRVPKLCPPSSSSSAACVKGSLSYTHVVVRCGQQDGGLVVSSPRTRPHAKSPAHVLALMLQIGRFVLFIALGGCYYIPVSPGCSPEKDLPESEDLFLHVGLAGDRGGATVGIDRAGRSQFWARSTVWMLSTPGSCKSIPENDVRLLEETWRRLSEGPRSVCSQTPQPPFVRIAVFGGVTKPDLPPDRVFCLKPDSQFEEGTVEEAAALTLSVLVRTYGDRFLREIQAAGLEPLVHRLPEPRADD